jgi:hypothetical protein
MKPKVIRQEDLLLSQRERNHEARFQAKTDLGSACNIIQEGKDLFHPAFQEMAIVKNRI